MIPGLDSATPPTADQVAAARAAGVRLWSGYLATMPGVNLLRPWSQAEFEVARACGGTPIAFASGWDDPVACKKLAAAWRVRLGLDVEDGIRPDGPWVQPWLDASGAGLYGNCGVHAGRSAAFHVLAWYPWVPPAATWNDIGCRPRPTGPCGWQSQGSHQEFGQDVDRGWYADWFGGNMLDPNDPIVQELQAAADRSVFIYNLLVYGNTGPAPDLPLWGIAAGDGTAKTDAILAAVKALAVPAGTTGPQLAAALRAAAHQLDGQ